MPPEYDETLLQYLLDQDFDVQVQNDGALTFVLNDDYHEVALWPFSRAPFCNLRVLLLLRCAFHDAGERTAAIAAMFQTMRSTAGLAISLTDDDHLVLRSGVYLRAPRITSGPLYVGTI